MQSVYNYELFSTYFGLFSRTKSDRLSQPRQSCFYWFFPCFKRASGKVEGNACIHPLCFPRVSCLLHFVGISGLPHRSFIYEQVLDLQVINERTVDYTIGRTQISSWFIQGYPVTNIQKKQSQKEGIQNFGTYETHGGGVSNTMSRNSSEVLKVSEFDILDQCLLTS